VASLVICMWRKNRWHIVDKKVWWLCKRIQDYC
jgi:hypothetical protein